jgi:2-polyprenyl-3-methyl-5-hydroxy-6-metoxy-1,4-benzoquinol methylase
MLQELYSKYYPRKNLDINKWEPHQEVNGWGAWLNGDRSAVYHWVPPQVRILDIGCGFGQTLGYHQGRGCEVYGVEADENIKRVVEKFGFNVHVGLFDANRYQPAYFDYVTMDQVIEHVDDPATVLKGIARILKPDGVAILSTPNADGWGLKFFGRKWEHWHIPYHLQIFSKNSLEEYAKEAGFKLEKTVTITNSRWLYFQWLHLAAYPKPGDPSAFWTLSGKTTFRQKVAFKLITWMHKIKINHLITRWFDWLGAGDNRIYLLRKQAG